MTKAEIVEQLHEVMQFSKKECIELVELTFALLKEVIVTEGKLKVSGFGVFEVKEKHARRGRNPQTGEELTITQRRVLSFKPSAVLKTKLNGTGV